MVAEKPQEWRTIDDVINTVGRRPNLLWFNIMTVAMGWNIASALNAYMIQFTGFIPWDPITCLSENCTRIIDQPADLLNVTLVCHHGLVLGQDYTWVITRTSLAVEWDLVCDQDKITFLESIYFVGGMVSLCLATYLFDMIGRRRVCIIGASVNMLAVALGIFCHKYSFMVGIRMLQGFGNFLTYSGCYIWVLEFMPEKYRNYYNSYSMMLWTAGYPLVVALGYTIKQWNYIHIGYIGVFALCFLPFTFFPDSPRYLLSVGREDEAKKVLERYGRITNTTISLKDVTLIGSANTKKEIETSFASKMSEYKKHPALALELVIQCYLWCSCCLLYYGVNYGWGSFGATPYVSYLLAAGSEIVAYIFLVLFIKFFGRRNTLAYSLMASSACFLLSIIPWKWSDSWSLDRLLALIVIIWIALAFALLFLYLGELAPTSLRGFTLALCGLLARLAAFSGPYFANSSGSGKLICASVMAAVGAGLTFFLPETRGLPIPAEAADVSERRKSQGLRVHDERWTTIYENHGVGKV